MNQNSRGYTLIEMMIALLIGAIVVAAGITIYLLSVKASTDSLRSAQLNQDVTITASLMTNDIRRAGYWGDAVTGVDVSQNPFTDLQIHDFDGENNACVLYTYDANADGVLDNDEYYGFRLNEINIQIKSGGTANVSDCENSTGWTDLTDTNSVEITGLRFTPDFKCRNPSNPSSTNPCSPNSGETSVIVRNIGISLEAESAGDENISSDVETAVRVRNNQIIAAP